MKVLALIDADVTAFKATQVIEREIDWGDGLWTLHCDLNEAKERAHADIAKLMAACKADKVVLVFTGDNNFRKEVLPSYKSNRKKTRKPVAYKPLVAYLASEYETFIREGLEGDDLLGILATDPRYEKGYRKVIVSIDKDLKTIPAWVYNPDKDKKPWKQTKTEAYRYVMVQTLMGDTTDGYKGCPGIGGVKALRALEDADPADFWSIVVGIYEKAGLGEGEALVQARVARILHASDYDFKLKKPILWNPPE